MSAPVAGFHSQSQGSERTLDGSQDSRVSILVNGKYDEVHPLSSGLNGSGTNAHGASTHRHRRSRRRQERLDFGWKEFITAFNKFDKVHNGLLPKYTARLNDGVDGPPRADGLSPRSAAENDMLSQQVLRIELQAMNDAWREMLLAYEQLSVIERESWTDESLCLDILPYIKSFTQFLEWEYKLIRGWTLPSRYRGQQIMDAPKAYQQAQQQRQAHVQAQADRYEEERQAVAEAPMGRETTTIDAVYADDPVAGQKKGDNQRPQDETQGGQANMTIVEEDAGWQTDDGEEPVKVERRASSETNVGQTRKGEASLLRATLVQTITTKVPGGTSGVGPPGTHVTQHGLSFTREALSQNLTRH